MTKPVAVTSLTHVAVPSAVVLAERLASLGDTPDDYVATVLPLTT